MTNPRDGTAAAADAGWLALRGRVCVITGAAGGIGEAIACDITDAGSVAKAAAAVEQASGGADVLVNNAGLLRPGAIDRLSVEEWNATLAVNLTGYFLCAQVFGRQMVAKQGGAMVHIASIAAHHPQTFSGSYSPSKAGVTMLSRQIAAEWGRHGLRSNVVSPGMIRTPLSQSLYAEPGVEQRRSEMIASRRIGRPEDIADVVLFLTSDRAGYVNGAEIVTDGGFDAMLMDLVPRPGFTGNEAAPAASRH